MAQDLNRREFVGAVAAGAPAARRTVRKPEPPKILNYNPNMEYRRLGKTGLMVSAVCLGGHWKRMTTMLGAGFKGVGYSKEDLENVRNPAFIKNRTEVLNRAAELGINYVDACAPPEIMAYKQALQGKRDKIYFGFSWYTREPRYKEWRTGKKLIEGLDLSLREVGLDYVDLWRVTLPMEAPGDLGEMRMVEEATMEALDKARRQGKVRFTGVSSHNRVWLKYMIETYPSQVQVVLFPYTADSKTLPEDSLFDALKQHDVGAFGIKPFGDNALFAGNSALTNPQAAEDDRRARLAIRYILGNPAITAPIPGLINTHQVENVAAAVTERRKLDRKEKAELQEAGRKMWANLRPGYEWLKSWEYV